MTPKPLTIQEINKEFDKKFNWDMCEECGSFKQGNTTNEQIKSFYATQFSLLVEGLVGEDRGITSEPDREEPNDSDLMTHGYNTAKAEIRARINAAGLEVKGN